VRVTNVAGTLLLSGVRRAAHISPAQFGPLAQPEPDAESQQIVISIFRQTLFAVHAAAANALPLRLVVLNVFW
jgi:hypothetical protein